jgi:hypothetical protein
MWQGARGTGGGGGGGVHNDNNILHGTGRLLFQNRRSWFLNLAILHGTMYCW